MTQEEFKNAFNENSTEVFQKFMQTMGTEGKQAQLILEEL
jgi:hypothetical protein